MGTPQRGLLTSHSSHLPLTQVPAFDEERKAMRESKLAILLLMLGCFWSVKKVDGYEEDDGDQLTPSAASMSSTHTKYNAEKCINGKDGDFCATQDNSQGKKGDPAPWLALDFGEESRVSVGKVVLANRPGCCGKRTAKVELRLTHELPADGASMCESGQLLAKYEGPGKNKEKIEIESEDGWKGFYGRYLLIQMDKTDKPDSLNLAEVTAFGKMFVEKSQCSQGE